MNVLLAVSCGLGTLRNLSRSLPYTLIILKIQFQLHELINKLHLRSIILLLPHLIKKKKKKNYSILLICLLFNYTFICVIIFFLRGNFANLRSAFT